MTDELKPRLQKYADEAVAELEACISDPMWADHAEVSKMRLRHWDAVIVGLQAEVERLNAIINQPQKDDFLRAVSTEAEHQRQRWSESHDAGKLPSDWFWLIGYLGGKALHAHVMGDIEKTEHHIITTAAACANWHLALFGKTDMRPGTATPAEDGKPCTCHPDDNPPQPCAKQYALSACKAKDEGWDLSGNQEVFATAAKKNEQGAMASLAKDTPKDVVVPMTMEEEFEFAMQGKQYGPEETRDAKAWFEAGWEARGNPDERKEGYLLGVTMALARLINTTDIHDSGEVQEFKHAAEGRIEDLLKETGYPAELLKK